MYTIATLFFICSPEYNNRLTVLEQNRANSIAAQVRNKRDDYMREVDAMHDSERPDTGKRACTAVLK
jgi:hypothetical protein